VTTLHPRGLHDRGSRWRQAVRRGWEHSGPERDTILLIVKSALAATIAWVLADVVLAAPSATFAPFSALLMVQVTISQSLDQALRYAGAVVAGVVLTAALSLVLGPTIPTFAILMLAGLTIGRWRRLGSQGSQVAVAALFAFSAFAQSSSQESSLTQLSSIAGLVVGGCAIGVLVNLLIVPPLRYRGGAYAVSSLSASETDLLTDMGRAMGAGMPDRDQIRDWSSRAGQIQGLVGQARASIEQAAESMRLNPRRLFMRETVEFSGYRHTVTALERANEQALSMTRGLDHAATRNVGPDDTERAFAGRCATVLDAAADAAEILGSIHTVADLDRDSDLDAPLERGRQGVQDASQHADEHDLDDGPDGPIFTGLLTDMRRLVEEFGQARQQLGEDTVAR
jgi:Aromatic acid exporter family member 1